ncbi:MAG TPA: asparaginase [Gemmatimonadaceae bacterium]|nr:asparaginase [Gemmatimonadaceae bacterium]
MKINLATTRKNTVLFGLIISAAAVNRGAAQNAPLSKSPEVLILATGGTIASGGNYYGDGTGSVSRASGEELLATVPGLDKVAKISAEQFSNVASTRFSPSDWVALSRRISAVFQERPALSGIVVTHGTDTMEETAYFLDLTVAGDRPVVVTGSMRPADAVGADGPANLFNAVRVAIAPASRGRGTLVLMNDRVFAAREVTKTNANRVESFQAPDHGPLATVDHDTLFFSHPHPTRPRPFDLANVVGLPRVDIVFAYAGADSVMIDAAVAAGAKGIVLAGFGRSGTPVQASALRRAASRGVVVVTATRTGSGRVLRAPTRISAGILNPQKARVLLMLALTRTIEYAEIAKIFDEYTNGEF